MRATVIWQPRYWDKKVLVDVKKVKPGKNYLYFACDVNLLDLYSYDGDRVLEEGFTTSNGKILCYEVPLDWLKNEGKLPEHFIPIREKEYAKFLKTKKRKKK